MYWRTVGIIGLLLMGMMLLSMPVRVDAQSDQMNAAPPSIGQQVVREGVFALKLGLALAVGTPQDEVEAENLLTEVGVMPNNGWIADYPVTPDIIDELYKAVRDAAASKRIPMSVDVALQRLNDVMSQVGLSIGTQSDGKTYSTQLPGTQDSPSSTVINNYYQNEGPPTVTYYAPPPDYYQMYGWVPFPFWSAGIWFPGFFILNDFHRTVFIDNRVVFVSNHFNDIRRHRIVRIDPITRFNGSSIFNTSLIHRRGGVSVMEPRRERTIINEPRRHTVPNIGTVVRTPARSDGVVRTPRNRDSVGPLPMRSGGTFSRPLREDRTMSVPARSEVVVGTPFNGDAMSGSTSRRGGFVSTPRSESPVFTPTSGGKDFSMPSRSGEFDRMPFRGNSGSGGRGRR